MRVGSRLPILQLGIAMELHAGGVTNCSMRVGSRLHILQLGIAMELGKVL
jgi:hypothetical protein